ncbi:nucleoside triphosphate pyrophosphohydrolase [Geodermatophilus sp. CPCC 205506]|uniref:nucleoside triphosphate pyrophosphohydrolase n=1 Tax=Geodermatophilus sp. CPCC 205506 TaxID=2936596 RepID=UPI003EEEC95B
MGKLVRDLIPDIIERSGRTPEVRLLGEAEYVDALHSKLLEEAEELRTADPSSRLEEAADVYEVLLAIAQTLDVDIADVAAAADVKRAERGGFERRIWLEA